jgi:hypothetical protein
MDVTPVDASTYAEVCSLLARHPFIFDNVVLEAVPAAYTADAVLGSSRLQDAVAGLPYGRVMFPHHTTDVAVHRVDDQTLRVWAKYFIVRGDGTAGSGDYQDTLVRSADGWRIARRDVSRGARPEDDPDGPSERTLDATSWLGVA